MWAFPASQIWRKDKMTFDETIAALRAGKCVSRPNENSYLVIEEKILTKYYKD